ncbi:MAG: PQQ-dependent sugar dehydrogenase, partial [Bacteroidota bacterium]
SEEVILTISQPFANHNAGDLAFGPDGMLYIPTGDGGGGGDPDDTGQDPTSLLGKMLRIDVDNTSPGLPYAIPADNPFVSDATVRDEIWALGLRNPWRISFDRQTGDLWIGDVGQNAREEVNFQAAGSSGGQNYGWDCREGFIAFNSSPSAACTNGSVYTDPLFEYNHSFSQGGFSLTGGFVYRGQNADDLFGWYVCADFAISRFFLLPPGDDGSGLVRQTENINDITTFGEDDQGNLYLATFGGDFIHVTTERSLPVTLSSWSARPQEKTVVLEWETSVEEGSDYFRLERSADGRTFTEINRTPTTGTASNYTYVDANLDPGTYYYRLFQVDLDGSEQAFGIRQVALLNGRPGWPALSPNPAERNLLVKIPELQQRGTVDISIFAADGRRVFRQTSTLEAGPQQISLELPSLPAGLYRAVMAYDQETFALPLTIR